MVTERTVWYSNAQWSSHLKERLLAVLESHAPRWADTFVGVGFFFFSPITNIRFLKNGLWVSQWLFIPLDLKELSFVSVTGILSHLNRLRGKEHESRHRGWWQSVTHTHMQFYKSYCWWNRTIYSESSHRTAISKFTFTMWASDLSTFSSTRPFFWMFQTGLWKTLICVCICCHLLQPAVS